MQNEVCSVHFEPRNYFVWNVKNVTDFYRKLMNATCKYMCLGYTHVMT